ncbi:MAG: N-acetyltransferase family protein [Methylocystis sp.]|uniref:GNAT family N-acetyltransferase n=1 Tax=Methylocystis sp. TaxID=1911079 RepID=UPI003DA46FB4
MKTSPDIRRGAETDIPAVAGVHLDSSRVAYRGICPDSVLDALTLSGRIELWRGRYHDLGPEGRLWIIGRPQVIGFAAADRADDAEDGGKTCELLSFYVLPEWWGKKIGYDLMQWLLEDFRQRQYRTIILWTIRSNRRARDFYERTGFVCDERARRISRRESGVLVEYDEIRYSRRLDD